MQLKSDLQVRSIAIIAMILHVLPLNYVSAQTSSMNPAQDPWRVPVSQNLVPHFAEGNGHKILYVD